MLLNKWYWKRRLFDADNGGGNGGSGGASDPAPAQDPPAAKVEFTPEQQAHIQKLIDAQHAKTAARFEKDYSKKLSDLQEAEKLKNMSEAERRQAEFEQMQGKIKEYEQERLATQFKLQLTEKGLPADYANFLNIADAEKAKGAVDFLTSYKETVTKPLNERIKELEVELNNANLRNPAPKSFGDKKDDPLAFRKSGQENPKPWMAVNNK